MEITREMQQGSLTHVHEWSDNLYEQENDNKNDYNNRNDNNDNKNNNNNNNNDNTIIMMIIIITLIIIIKMIIKVDTARTYDIVPVHLLHRLYSWP